MTEYNPRSVSVTLLLFRLLIAAKFFQDAYLISLIADQYHGKVSDPVVYIAAVIPVILGMFLVLGRFTKWIAALSALFSAGVAPYYWLSTYLWELIPNLVVLFPLFLLGGGDYSWDAHKKRESQK